MVACLLVSCVQRCSTSRRPLACLSLKQRCCNRWILLSPCVLFLTLKRPRIVRSVNFPLLYLYQTSSVRVFKRIADISYMIARGPAVHSTVITWHASSGSMGGMNARWLRLRSQWAARLAEQHAHSHSFLLNILAHASQLLRPFLPICHFGFVPVCSRKASNAIT